MDIVYNNVNTNKYIDHNDKRHVSLSNNIAYWFGLHTKCISKKNKQIIGKYTKIMNRKDIDTLIKCTKHNINIVPILHQLNNNDINLLINEALKYMNINIMKHINYDKIDHDLITKQLLIFCKNGNIDTIKYLHKEFELTKQDFQSNNNSCRYVNTNKYIDHNNKRHVSLSNNKRHVSLSNNKRHVSLSNNIAYWFGLHTEYISKKNKQIISKYTKIMNRKDINTLIKCTKHNINIVPILHQLNNNDINLLINEALKYMNINMMKHINYDKIDRDLITKQLLIFYKNGNINIVKYLHKEFGLTKQDFQSNNNSCLRVCEYDHFDVVKYLHKEIGLTKQDFQSDNYACRRACEYGHFDVVKYLHKEIELTKTRFLIR